MLFFLLLLPETGDGAQLNALAAPGARASRILYVGFPHRKHAKRKGHSCEALRLQAQPLASGQVP
jgi:16S rRNA C1402 (ribose-2'-O) methylase RsmI